MTTRQTPSYNTHHGFDLGLRLLDAQDAPPSETMNSDAGFNDVLHTAETLPPQRRLRWARLWPGVAALNGVLAFSGLMVWPNGSGVHLLVFLLAFWLVPVGLWSWTLVSTLLLKRAPWWRNLVTPHMDAVVAAWCGRQALLAQLAFATAGVAWMWLMLATRQVIFYWSTSIDGVSSRVDDLFRLVSLGVIDRPEPLVVGAAQAGAITGWDGGLLSHSYYWAAWLSQAVALWVVLPAGIALVVCHGVLRRRIRQWPRWNRVLALRLESMRSPELTFHALQPEQPVTEPPAHEFPVVRGQPTDPGFIWQSAIDICPEGSVLLGGEHHQDDVAKIDARARTLDYWYIPGYAVPTGDLADLITHHRDGGGNPRLCVMLGEGVPEARLDALKHSWSAFLDRNRLILPLEFVLHTEVAHGRS